MLATIGPSYLGYVQFALAADAPPELRAMVVQAAMPGPYHFMYPGGVFALENVLVATAATLGFEHGMAAVIRTGLRVQRRMRRVSRELPLIRAYPPALGGRVTWLEDWLPHPDQADPYWAGLQIPWLPSTRRSPSACSLAGGTLAWTRSWRSTAGCVPEAGVRCAW